VTAVLAASLATLPAATSAPDDDRARIERVTRELERRAESRKPALYHELLRSTNPVQAALNANPDVALMGIDGRGHPLFYTVHNIDAAMTTRTAEVWPGGGAGYSLTGAETLTGELALWDGGVALSSHDELTGRVTIEPWVQNSHATHVAATMIASGVDPQAKGMSHEAMLDSYYWNNDTEEMWDAALNGLLVSNHSYGLITGWAQTGPTSWAWYGDVAVGTSEDYRFGFYDSLTAEWDLIAFNAPNYLIVKSAGNDRNDPGVPAGTPHDHWENGGWVSGATDFHPPDGSPFGYDTIGMVGVAKNVLTVGAVKDIPAGYTQPDDVVQTEFSSWGPADDGRIKPDLVANGDSLWSADSQSANSYRYRSGTSMAAPNVSGSVNLLKDLYRTTYAQLPRAATMKALVLHTADEAGPAEGPDYSNGWGLLNTRAAADLITASPESGSGIIEDILVQGQTNSYEFTVTSTGDVRLTVAWTDPPGTPSVVVIDAVAKMLVNDLDIRIESLDSPGTVYFPWRLDRTNPLGVAAKGDNDVDNVERIDVIGLPAGNYVATVSHEGSITYGEQLYSLIWSGMVPSSVVSVGEGGVETPSLALRPVRPNPVSEETQIEYAMSGTGPVWMAVYDVRGRRVATLLDRAHGPSSGVVRFDARDVPSGVYFVRMESPTARVVRKLEVLH
jgi:hypothetical protein